MCGSLGISDCRDRRAVGGVLRGDELPRADRRDGPLLRPVRSMRPDDAIAAAAGESPVLEMPLRTTPRRAPGPGSAAGPPLTVWQLSLRKRRAVFVDSGDTEEKMTRPPLV